MQGGACIITPRAKRRADDLLKAREQEELAAEAVKVTKKQLQLNNKLLKEKTKADNAEKAAKKREETAQRKAQEQHDKDARAAEKAQAKAIKDAQKASQLPKQARKKASKKPQSKYQKVVVVQRSVVPRWLMSLARLPQASRPALAASHSLQTN
jgi:hypothetical protein